jgi:hypothetical protein
MADPIRNALRVLLNEIDDLSILEKGPHLHDAVNEARAALAAAPPAPDPREALAARPLLEAVARMADRIGQHTVGEITAISNRAAAWLAENPPGQPVAIEPRGCPAPGACSCVEPPAPAPTINDIFELCEDHEFHLGRDGANEEESAEGLLQIIRVALARWGNQPPAPDHLRTATEMVADGEREELAQWLENLGDDYDDLYRSSRALVVPRLARAAALLRHTVKGWQPISTAPKDGTEILTSDYDSIEIASWDEREALWANRDGDILLPAWWHPLPVQPEPPQGGEVAE